MCVHNLTLNYSAGPGLEPRPVHVQSLMANAHHVKPPRLDLIVLLEVYFEMLVKLVI